MPILTAHLGVIPIPFTKLAATVLCILWVTGCFDGTPTDVKLLREGAALESRSEYDKALAKYTEAASLGNADAFKRLGDMTISRDYALLRPENTDDRDKQGQAMAFSPRSAPPAWAHRLYRG